MVFIGSHFLPIVKKRKGETITINLQLTMKINIYASVDELLEKLAQFFIDSASQSILDHGRLRYRFPEVHRQKSFMDCLHRIF